MNSDSSTSSGLLRRLARAFLLWFVLPLCLLTASALSALFLFCAFKPELMAATVQHHLIRATGLSWRIKGPLKPTLRPVPGIEIFDVRILASSEDSDNHTEANRPLLQTRSLRLSLVSSFFWPLSPGFFQIQLDSPTVHMACDTWPSLAPDKKTDGAKQSASSQGSKNNGKASREALIDFLLTSPTQALPFVYIQNGRLLLYSREGQLLHSLADIEARLSPFASKDHLTLSASLSMPNADLAAHFSLTAMLGHDTLSVSGFFSGLVSMTPPGSQMLSASFSSGFSWQRDGHNIRLSDVTVAAENDSLSANLLVDLKKAECSGMVHVHKLSLPRWFQFARNLPPGLQYALNSLEGNFDLALNMHGAEAGNIHAVAGSLVVDGFVRTPDFTAPVVEVDLNIPDNANLDLVLPFLAAPGMQIPDPASPEFTHPPLVPYPQTSSLTGEDKQVESDLPDVGYDIVIRVPKPRLHDVDGGSLLVRVFPIIINGLEKTRVSIEAKELLQGNTKGRLDIDEHSISMHYDVKGMELSLLPENTGNTVRFFGPVTGVCQIEMPLLENGSPADVWTLGINAAIDEYAIKGNFSKNPWSMSGSRVEIKGEGKIFAVLSKGVYIDGRWNLAFKKIRSSWHPKGADSLSGEFAGKLSWAPVKELSPVSGQQRTMHSNDLESMAGDLTLQGTLTAPVGSLLAPISGKLHASLDWPFRKNIVTFSGIKFTGFSSYCESKMTIDMAGSEVTVRSENSFKINPHEIMTAWKVPLPTGMRTPRLLTGKAEITGKSRSLLFDRLLLEVDGAPVTGSIAWEKVSASSPKTEIDTNLWTIRLKAQHMNLDMLFPPAPPGQAPLPSTTPWELGFIKGLSVDAQVDLQNARRTNLVFSNTKVIGTLQRNRFSLHSATENFYDGKLTLLFQGVVVPEKSQITLRKGTIQGEHVSLGKTMHDYTGNTSYAGTADILADMSGLLGCDVDIPGKLSGIWHMRIRDGLYPAFLGGAESRLRNTFNEASLGGVLEQGVLRSDNFKLSGTMVTMSGGGWYDLNTRDMDIQFSVTIAKVPTVPVRMHGNANSPRMNVRGVDMAVETVQNAGIGLFELVRGVLEMPAKALQGIGSLFGLGDTPQEKLQKIPPASSKKPAKP